MEQQQQPLRIGVIGIGNIGFVHASCIFKGGVTGAMLAAVCDVKPHLRQEMAECFPGVPFYENHRQLLEDPNIDAVIVSVPHPSHSNVATDAFRAGKHVLVEKPMDITLSKGKALCEVAKESGKVFGIMFNQRTGKLFAKAREIISSGQLGQLKRSVWIITNWYRTQHYYDSGTWRATWVGEGGGVLVNQAPHQLDLWQWICGMPEKITAFCTEAKYHRIEVEDDATIVAKFPGGAEGIFVTSTGEYPGTNRLEISGTKGKLVLENGKLKWWQLRSDERDFCVNSEESFAHIPMDYTEISDEQGAHGHQKILQNFTDHILHGEPLLAPGYDGIRELTIQNAAYLSAWKGSIPVALPFDEAEYDALLQKRQDLSSVASGAASDRRRTEYSERWQINW